jgi:DNA-binding beta-propeller fold protein YncE
MNLDSMIEALTCQLDISAKTHLFSYPKKLPCCNRIGCNDCFVKLLQNNCKKSSSAPNHFYFDCSLCEKRTKIGIKNDDEVMLEIDEEAERALDSNLIEINHYIIKKLDGSIKHLNDRFESRDAYLSRRKAFIQNEIHDQVEAIKKHLDNLEIEMNESLEKSSINMIANIDKYHNLVKNDIDNINKSSEYLKANAFSYANHYEKKISNGDLKSKEQNRKRVDLSVQHHSVNTALNNLNDLKKINRSLSDMVDELRFDPNYDLPSKSIIGRLKNIKEINLMEQFKVLKSQTQISRIGDSSGQQNPISPKYLCIPDQYRLLFTDSQSKQIVELKLETGDFSRSTNLNGQIKNPDGICSNHKGHIYVTDAEHNFVFKLDSQLNLVKKFGQKDLKWPRGIVYDPENYFSSGKTNSNHLYVCDFVNQRVAIFNDHEQLRDSITISTSNDMDDKINKKQHLVEEENRFCPLNVATTKNYIYVTDDWTGGNCIRMFDKESHRLLKNIGHLNAWNPLGLVIDDNGYLFTMARLYYETGTTYLFCFDRDGELMYRTNLNLNSESIGDVIVDNYTERAASKRMICVGEKKIHFFKF